jgi:hypothetical protein
MEDRCLALMMHTVISRFFQGPARPVAEADVVTNKTPGGG